MTRVKIGTTQHFKLGHFPWNYFNEGWNFMCQISKCINILCTNTYFSNLDLKIIQIKED